MLKKLLAILILPMGLTSLACEGEITWTFNYTADWNVDFNDNGGVGNKLIQIDVEINPGSNVLDANSVILHHSWREEAPQDDTADPSALDWTATATAVTTSDINPDFVNTSSTPNIARFFIIVQYGWNRLEVEAEATSTNAKGQTKTEAVQIPVKYFFGDMGSPIPFTATLVWDQPNTDLDLVVNETDGVSYNRWVFWANSGYSDFEPKNGTQRDYNQGIVRGVNRANNDSHGSIDSDDVKFQGPEIYSIDPADKDGFTHPNGGIQDGTTFTVYVNHYDFSGTGTDPDTTGQITIEFRSGGTRTTECYTLPDLSYSMTPDESGITDIADLYPGPADVNISADHLVEVGTFTYYADGNHTWSFANAGENTGKYGAPALGCN